MDVSTASRPEDMPQAGSEAACCDEPRGPVPRSSAVEVETVPGERPEGAPARLVLARIPDVDADDLWDEQTTDRPRDGRLLSQRVSLKLLGAGALLLVAVAVAPFLWPGNSRDQNQGDGLPDWHPGPPAPSAEMAPAWKAEGTQPDWQTPTHDPSLGSPAPAPPGAPQQLLPGTAPGASGFAGRPQAGSGTPGAALGPEGSNDPRLHVLAPPSGPYGAAQGHAAHGHRADEGAGYPESPSYPEDARARDYRAGVPSAGEYPGAQMPPSSPALPAYPHHNADPGTSQYPGRTDAGMSDPYRTTSPPGAQPPRGMWHGDNASRRTVDGAYDSGPAAQQTPPPGPSVYDPSSYNPSSYNPSTHSPSAYDPRAYNPRAYNSSGSRRNPSDDNSSPRAHNPGAYGPSPSYDSNRYDPSSYDPGASGSAGASPAQATWGSGVADRRASVSPYRSGATTPSADYRADSRAGYPADYRAGYSADYPADHPAGYAPGYPGTDPGAQGLGSGGARLEGTIERPEMGSRY